MHRLWQLAAVVMSVLAIGSLGAFALAVASDEGDVEDPAPAHTVAPASADESRAILGGEQYEPQGGSAEEPVPVDASKLPASGKDEDETNVPSERPSDQLAEVCREVLQGSENEACSLALELRNELGEK